MKRIAIYCVNYNSYQELYNYLASIDQAAIVAKEEVEVDVLVADNTVEECLEMTIQSSQYHLHLFPFHQNMGYFGAVRRMMEEVSPLSYDFSIISNVDILLHTDFFLQLLTADSNLDTGWIAPQIYSRVEHRDRNPKIMQRYSKRKLQILRTLFRIPLLYNLYTHTVYKSKKLLKHEPGEIYAGHGSFIILTHEYFTRCGIIDYPVFLFCEEIYLGEQCRLHDLKVVYRPDIHVDDAEHASTGTFKRSKYCKYNFQAISHILKNYYT